MACTRCYGKIPLSVPLPDEKNAGIGARILFLCERPGRTGTGASGWVSFENQDSTAACFKRLFSTLGIDRKDIFIANAVFCYPLVGGYRDKPPTRKELRNCLPFLQQLVETIRPELTVTLGNTALLAIKHLFSDSFQLMRFSLKDNVGELVTDTHPPVYPLYHTSARARVARPEQQQMKDWRKIPEILERLNISDAVAFPVSDRMSCTSAGRGAGRGVIY
jgi:uracil-DNA glycosylase family 4